TTKDRLIAEDPKSAEIIRPILRGRDIKRYSYDFHDQWLIASHNGYTNDAGIQIPRIDIDNYPAIKAHLEKYWDAIVVRTDKGETPYNLRSCAYMDDFSKQKIVWGEISDKTKFSIDIQGRYYPEATTFLMTGTDLKYLLAFLNSSFSEYFFSVAGTTTGMGTVRWKKYKIEQLPIVKPSQPQLQIVEKLVEAIAKEEYGSQEYRILEQTINSAIYKIVGLSDDETQFIESL
ncbi:MAG: hypothetical protein LBJ48_02810, partial [Coriobacteriales bacterium]|nr:hypothetical protein [Coriobacteriales bacterium]